MNNKVITLDEAYKAIINVLENQNLIYLVIGGFAIGILGEARVTQDLDIEISINDKNLPGFLKAAKAKGFKFDKEKINEDIKFKGSFKFMYGSWRVDFIVGLMPFEESAFSRSKRIKLYDTTANFPTPEDLVLLKLIPGREKDMLDIKGILIRHKGKMDLKYMRHWAEIISNDLQTNRIYDTLNKLLAST